jgi:hypothetical protein
MPDGESGVGEGGLGSRDVGLGDHEIHVVAGFGCAERP